MGLGKDFNHVTSSLRSRAQLRPLAEEMWCVCVSKPDSQMRRTKLSSRTSDHEADSSGRLNVPTNAKCLKPH